jgi:hypothetical protein
MGSVLVSFCYLILFSKLDIFCYLRVDVMEVMFINFCLFVVVCIRDSFLFFLSLFQFS